MEVKFIYKANSHVLLEVIGDVLMENSKDFINSVVELLSKESNITQLTLNFTKVLFVDSSGIGALIKLTSEMKKKSVNLNILGLNKNLRTVFQLSGISSIIKIFSEEDFCLLHPEFRSYLIE